MLVEEILTKAIPPVSTNDKAETALQYMEDWKVSHLAVVGDNRFRGLLEESSMAGFVNEHTKVKEFDLLDVSAEPGLHIFEAIRLITDYKLTLLPVVDEAGMFQGEVTASAIMTCLSQMSAVREEGSVIILEMADVDYSLADISRHIEANDAKVLSAIVSRIGDGHMIEVALKINQKQITGPVQTLQRFNYKIKAYYDAPTYESELKERYDELMRYLNI